jgi:plasmid rolling circle replication initiator protein Rep
MKNDGNPTAPNKPLHNIYKLEQLRNSTNENTLASLKKRAKAKYAQNNLMRVMKKLDSPYKEKYEDTMNCSSVLQQQGNSLTSRYCKHRWCRVCNRIRTGKLINGYSQALEEMKDKQFITLTVKNCPGDKLKETIQLMIKTFRLIQELRRKKKLPLLKCIRKLECTYNPDTNEYHPHFHVIVEGLNNGQYLINEWLKRNTTADIKGQDIRECYEAIELFKYFTKLTSKSAKDTKHYKGSRLINDEWHYPEALDLIFRAIEGIRIIQPMGGVKMVSDEIDELQTQVIEDLQEDFTIWIYRGSDWIDTSTAEMLTGYTPTDKEYKYSKRIRYLD